MQVRKAAATFAALTLIFGVGCSGEDSPTPAASTSGASTVDELVSALPNWQQPPDYLNSSAVTPQTITQWEEPIPDYKCNVQEHTWAKRSNEVFAPEQDFSTLWPGAVFHGSPYKYGSLDPLAAARSPITLFSNMPGSKSVTVDSPSAVSMNDAVNEIRGSVAPDAYQSEWEFLIDEVYSNRQGTMEIGANAGYSSAVSGALSFSEERTVTRHVMFGRAVQRMFTIRFADGDLKKPSDFFDPTVTAQHLRDAGVTDSNTPVYVRSITYGQMVLFKAVISIDGSSEKFKADFKGAWKGFTGGGSGGSTGTDLLKRATYEAVGYGGDPGNSGNAISAVADQKFGTFFDGATVQNAVPLFFEVVTLKDGQPAGLGESVVYQTWDNCKAATGYEFKVDFRRIKADKKVDKKLSYELDVKCGVAATPRDIYLTPLMNFPVGNKWYPINKKLNCFVNTNPLSLVDFGFVKTGGLIADPWYVEYPYKNFTRNVWLEALPKAKETIKDGILPNSPERTITADVWVRLEPTYD